MKVIIGSVNKDKIEILKKAFKSMHICVDVSGVEVRPQIDDQPLDENIAIIGSINRAKNAKKIISKGDLWIGLEGGLHDYGSGYFLVTYASIIDENNNCFIGTGEKIALPRVVSNRVKRGGWFGDIIREYGKLNKIDENLITREVPFIKAIQVAYIDYLKDRDKLVYRNKASGLIVNTKKEILLVQLQSYGKNDWSIPGGGIDDGEKPEDAVLRELREELGTNKFEIVERSKIINSYDFPDSVIINNLINKNVYFKGQIQTQFVLRFWGDDVDIQIQRDEIRKYKWIKITDLKKHLHFPGQLQNINNIIESSKYL